MPVKAVQDRQTFEDLVAAKRRSHSTGTALVVFFCVKEPLMQFASGNKRCLCRRLFLGLLLLLPPKSRCLLPAFQPAALVHPGRITVPVATPLPTPATRLHHPAKALKRRRSPAGPQRPRDRAPKHHTHPASCTPSRTISTPAPPRPTRRRSPASNFRWRRATISPSARRTDAFSRIN
jgi:hypothetical protein